MDSNIRQMTITDYDNVFRLWQASEGVALSDADSRERIRQYLDRNPGMSFVSSTGGKVVGAVLAGHDGRRGYIHHLAVHPDCRKQGTGRNLVDHCLKALIDKGIRKCHIFIFNDNVPGIEFWKSLGWTPRSDIGVISKTI
jgi:N-acetylglutamate synthase